MEIERRTVLQAGGILAVGGLRGRVLLGQR